MHRIRLLKLTAKNYRQFKDFEIKISKKELNSLTLIIAQNGTGKTNFLNALNWCLYGDEPHLDEKSAEYPIFNISTLNMENGSRTETEVSVEAVLSEDPALASGYEVITVRRSQIYSVSRKGDIRWDLLSSDLVTSFPGRSGTNLLKGNDAQSFLNRLIPKDIRHFFFFDGERLSSYFSKKTEGQVKHSVFQMAQVDKLEGVSEKLRYFLSDLRKESGKDNPDIDGKLQIYNALETSFSNAKAELDSERSKLKDLEEQMDSIEAELREVPDVEQLQTNREALKKESDELGNELKSTNEERVALTFETEKIVLLSPAIRAILALIREKRKHGEMPPKGIDPEVLETITKTGACSVCGSKLTEGGKEHIFHLLENITINNNTSTTLMEIQGNLNLFRRPYEAFKSQVDKINQTILKIEKRMQELEEGIAKIDKEMTGYNEETIRLKATHLKSLREARAKSEEDEYFKRVNHDQIKGKKDAAWEDYQSALNKEGKVKKTRERIEFSSRALDVVENIKEEIIEETRHDIAEETKKEFLMLTWKQSTFNGVNIDNDYNLVLLDRYGLNMIGAASAGEKQLLALSFTKALHKVSGFDAPILIDTPAARISDINRENLARMYRNLGSSTQTVLLLTPSEFDSDFVKGLGDCDHNIYSMRYLESENMVVLEDHDEFKSK